MKVLFALLALSPFHAAAAEDLSLPGARWLGNANGFVCANATTQQVQRPEGLENFAVNFETVTTDYSLDNGLLKANFVEDGVNCRYSALILADNTAKTLKLVDSVAYAPDAGSSCEKGKALLDGYLAANSYLYWGRPHHLTILVEDSSAAAVCGEGAASFGIDFVLAGKL